MIIDREFAPITIKLESKDELRLLEKVLWNFIKATKPFSWQSIGTASEVQQIEYFLNRLSK